MTLVAFKNFECPVYWGHECSHLFYIQYNVCNNEQNFLESTQKVNPKTLALKVLWKIQRIVFLQQWGSGIFVRKCTWTWKDC